MTALLLPAVCGTWVQTCVAPKMQRGHTRARLRRPLAFFGQRKKGKACFAPKWYNKQPKQKQYTAQNSTTKVHGCTGARASKPSYCYLLPADELLAVVLFCELSQVRLDDPASEPEHQVECGFLLDVVVRKGSAIFELLTGKDETLLVWRDL